MRLGVFGGSFDPVHVGHLIMAEQCREQGRLDQVLFIPAARPPHKQHQVLTQFSQRVEMLELAISGNPAFRIDQLEKDRPGPSFTVETLAELHQRQPDTELFLIMGSDSLADLPHWYEPRKILELASLLVVGRPGSEGVTEGQVRAQLGWQDDFPIRVQTIHSPLIEIASREIRKRTAEGLSNRYQIPRAVEAYIEQHGLYRTS